MFAGGDLGPVAIADLDGDGNLDVTIAHSCAPNGATVLLGDGAGVVRPQLTYAMDQQAPLAIAIGDLDGDGKPDLIEGGVTGGILNVVALLHVP